VEYQCTITKGTGEGHGEVELIATMTGGRRDRRRRRERRRKKLATQTNKTTRLGAEKYTNSINTTRAGAGWEDTQSMEKQFLEH
jgi:hypothetical protein